MSRNIPAQLILADTPWGIGIGLTFFILTFVAAGLLIGTESPLGGAVFALVGGGMGLAGFAVFVRRVQVFFDRPDGTILIRRSSLFGGSAMTHPLADLTRAETETVRGRDRRRMHRTSLMLTGPSGADHIPLVQIYASGRSTPRMTQTINDWHGVAWPGAQDGLSTPVTAHLGHRAS